MSIYRKLFQSIFETVIKNEDDPYSYFFDFLKESATDLNLVRDLFARLPLYSLYKYDAYLLMIKTNREVLVDAFRNNCKIVRLSIPFFQNDRWLTTKTRCVIPKRLDDKRVSFDFSIRGNELNNHQVLRTNDISNFVKTAYYDGVETNEDLALFCSLDILDPRYIGEINRSHDYVLRCYVMVCFDILSEHKRKKVISTVSDVDCIHVTVSFDIESLIDYYAILMTLSDVKHCFYTLKNETLQECGFKTDDKYIRNVWYGRGTASVVENLFQRNFRVGEGDVGIPLLRSSPYFGGSLEGALNVDLQTIRNTDSYEYHNTYNPTSALTVDQPDDVVKMCYSPEGLKRGSDDGYVINFDVECRGNYGWFASREVESKRRYFPEPMRLKTNLEERIDNISIPTTKVDVCFLKIDCWNAYLDYMRLKWKSILSEWKRFNDVVYELGLVESCCLDMVISRIDELRIKLFVLGDNISLIPCDYLRKDVDDVSRECRAFNRSNPRLLVSRHMGLYKLSKDSLVENQSTDETERMSFTRDYYYQPTPSEDMIDKFALFLGYMKGWVMSDDMIVDRVYKGYKCGYSPNYGYLLCRECVSTVERYSRDNLFSKDVIGSTMIDIKAKIDSMMSDNPPRTFLEFMIALKTISTIHANYKHIFKDVVNILRYSDQEYVECSNFGNIALRFASYGCATTINQGTFDENLYKYLKMQRFPKCHIYDTFSVSIPRYDPKNAYVGCCGRLSSNQKQHYGRIQPLLDFSAYYENGALLYMLSDLDVSVGKSFDDMRDIHTKLLSRLNNNSTNPDNAIGRKLKHYIHNGGLKRSVVYDISNFDATYHYGYLGSVDFEDSLLYNSINNTSGLPKVLHGRANRHSMVKDYPKTRQDRFYEYLGAMDHRISLLKIGWRRDFCDLKSKIISCIYKSNAKIDNDISKQLWVGRRMGLKCKKEVVTDDFGISTNNLVIDSMETEDLTHPIDVRTDWCFRKRSYNIDIPLVRIDEEHLYELFGDVSTVNVSSLSREYQYKVKKTEKMKLWYDLCYPDACLTDFNIVSALLASGIRPVNAFYVKIIDCLVAEDEFERRRLSLSDLHYGIIEDYIFKYYEQDLRKEDSVDDVAKICCGILYNSDGGVHCLSELSAYNGLKSIFHEWVHSCVLTEIAIVLKYERLLEGRLFFDTERMVIGVGCYENNGTIMKRAYVLDFFLGLYNVVGSRIYNYNEPMSHFTHYRKYSDMQLFGDSKVGCGLMKCVSTSSIFEMRYDFLRGARCYCTDCCCGNVNILSAFGGSYKCITKSKFVNTTFDYVFGVRQQYGRMLNDGRLVVDLGFETHPIPHISSYNIDGSSEESFNDYARKQAGEAGDNDKLVGLAQCIASRYKHALQCCEIAQQHKIHGVICERSPDPNADMMKCNIVKLIMTLFEPCNLTSGAVSTLYKKYTIIDYLYTGGYDGKVKSSYQDCLMVLECLRCRNLKLGGDVLMNIFGYGSDAVLCNHDILRKMTSKILTYLYNLPTLSLVYHNNAIPMFTPRMTCELLDHADRNDTSGVYSDIVNVTFDSLSLNVLDRKKPLWVCLPLCMVVYRTYLNLKYVYDALFDPKINFLFNDPKYALSVKLKLSLTLCLRLGRITLSPLKRSEDNSGFQSPFRFDEKKKDSIDNRATTVRTVNCNDTLRNAASALWEELGDFAMSYYYEVVSFDEEERQRKKRKIDHSDGVGSDSIDLWSREFGNRGYTELELADAFYALSITKVISSEAGGYDHCLKSPNTFLNAITNILWYDEARIYCHGKHIAETNEWMDECSDLNEFI